MERFDPYAVTIGRVIRGAIAQAGLNQDDVAEQLAMGRRSLSRRINGHLPFTWPEVVRVADITGTTATDLAAAADRLAKQPAVT